MYFDENRAFYISVTWRPYCTCSAIMGRPSSGSSFERKPSSSRKAKSITVVVLVLFAVVFLANLARTHGTSVVTNLTADAEADSSLGVAPTFDDNHAVDPFSSTTARATRAEELERATAAELEAGGLVSPMEPAAGVIDTPLSSSGSPNRASVPSASRPPAVAGRSGSGDHGAAAPIGSGAGSGGSGGTMAGGTKNSSESPTAAGSLGALSLQADQPATDLGETAASTGATSGFGGSGDPMPAAAKNSSSASPVAAESLGGPQHTDTPARSQTSDGPSGTPALPAGPPSNPFDLPDNPASLVTLPSLEPSQAAGGPPDWLEQPPNTPPGTRDAAVSTAGKELPSDSFHTADTTTPPHEDGQNQSPAAIPEPGTTLLMIGAAAAYAARRFRKGPAPRA